MALRAQKQSLAPLEGKWVADTPNSLYRKWSGTGFPCTVCFRLWNVTDAHPDTRGACPWVCIEAFANDKHLEMSKPAASRPSLDASAAVMSLPPPAVDTPAPPVEGPTAAAFHSVRLTELAPGGGNAIDPVGTSALVVPAEDADASPPPDEPEEPACYGAALDDEDDTDWPAFRSSPIWLPKSSAVTGDEHGDFPEP
ncbi:hypothetical protein CYMTET_56686 [Cymbomonas tetramitiformis]|uniref:Uncharacterized protein n=1 Tax=Cymbomonas tetramitiformis TaxID=36881 RepID=A0AAE0ENI2_9CHLO|nr:hypothetical protein CYMTET_56686 [Cymbomonas tetramitiformis]